MSFADRVLYHQIHPLKVVTDVTSGTLALVLLWQHHAAIGLLSVVLPSSAASALLILFADLESYRRSTAGRYMRRFITPQVVLLRLAVYAAMMIGAWRQSGAFLAVGFVGLLLCWFYGVLVLALRGGQRS